MDVFRLAAEAQLSMGPRYIAVALVELIRRGRGKVSADVPKLMATIVPGDLTGEKQFRHWLSEVKRAGIVEWHKEGERWFIRLAKDDTKREKPKQKLMIGSPAVLLYPCSGPIKEWTLTEAQVEEWQRLYPAVDVMQACRSALAWVNANHCKTAKGMTRFLQNWIERNLRDLAAGKSGSFGAARDEKPRGALARALSDFGMN